MVCSPNRYMLKLSGELQKLSMPGLTLTDCILVSGWGWGGRPQLLENPMFNQPKGLRLLHLARYRALPSVKREEVEGGVKIRFQI